MGRRALTIQKNLLTEEILPQVDSSQGDGENISSVGLADFIRVVRVRRKLILGVALTVVALTLAFVTEMTPLYSAKAVVMLDQRKNNLADLDSVLSGLPSDKTSVENQVQILTSLELAGRVVDKLHLERDPEFNSKLGGWSALTKYLNPFAWFQSGQAITETSQGIAVERSAIIHRFLNRLTVTPVGLSTAISISVETQDPNKSAQIANTVADAYVEDQLEAKFQATQKATQWLSGRISELSKQAQIADAAVQRYKAEHNINTATNGNSVIEQQMTDISAQLALAKANLAEKQANYNSLLTLEKAGQAASAAQVISSPLIATLRAQESDLNRQLADLSSKYLPSHPKILNLEAQKDNLEAKINEEVQRIVESVHNDVTSAAAHAASLQASLSQLEAQGAGQNQSAVQLTALQSAATSARAMYEAFLGRLNQTQGQEGIQTPDARVISYAEVPTAPSFPNKSLALGIAVPAGLLLGFLLALSVERLDSGFRTSAQIEAMLGLPVVTVIPESVGQNPNVADLIVEKPMSAFTEAIRGLQLGLMLSNVDKQPQVIVVTSSVPSEGKTTAAISLARMGAHAGLKVAIVDGDLRRPNVLKTLGLPNPETGLIEAATGKAKFADCITADAKTSAVILPCLKTPPNPADVLGSNAFANLLHDLRKKFDMVIIDSAPLLPVNDTKILSRLADAVVFVVRWEKTPRAAAANAVRMLHDARAPVTCIALTRADTERFQYYSYGYHSYYGYNGYYSD